MYLWVDDVNVKASLEKTKDALQMATGGLAGGRKVVPAVEPGYRESSAGLKTFTYKLLEGFTLF